MSTGAITLGQELQKAGGIHGMNYSQEWKSCRKDSLRYDSCKLILNGVCMALRLHRQLIAEAFIKEWVVKQIMAIMI